MASTLSRYRMTREDKARRHEAQKMDYEQQRQNRPGMKKLVAEEKAREKAKEKAKLKRNKKIKSVLKSGAKGLVKRGTPVGAALGIAYDLAKGRGAENFKNIEELERGKISKGLRKIKPLPADKRRITYRMNGGQVVDSSYD